MSPQVDDAWRLFGLLGGVRCGFGPGALPFVGRPASYSISSHDTPHQGPVSSLPKGTIKCAGSVIGVGGKACRTWNAPFACGLFVVVATAHSARYSSRGGDLARSTRLADAIFSCCARAAGDARNVLTWVFAAITRFTCSQQNALRAIANHRNSQDSNGLLEQQWILAEGRLSCTLGLVRCTKMEKFAGAH